MHPNIPHCNSRMFILLIVIIACICASAGADETYYISTIAGTGNGALKVNVPALEATCGLIHGLAQSKNGDIFVASQHNVVLKFEFDKEEGTWSNVTIIAGTGFTGKGAEGVLGTQSALNNPSGLSLIENANGEVTAILIADMNNNRIRKLDMSTRIITTIAGTSVQGNTGDEGPVKDAQLWLPRHVYYDKSNGDIYITDSNNNRIRRVRDGIITTVVGKTCTDSDGLGDGGPATGACLKSPNQLIMNDAREWFIVDSGNVRIRKVYLNDTITTFVGGGTETDDAPAASVKLIYPKNIVFTPSGELLVAEYSGMFVGIRKMDSSGFTKIIADDDAGGSRPIPPSDKPILAKSASVRSNAVIKASDGSDTVFIGDARGYIFMLSNRTKCYSVWSDNSAVCSGHGTCIGPDECQCDSGWMGADCSITHCFGVTSNLPDRVCSGKGKCVRPNKCHCRDGFGGHKCHRPIN